MTSPTRRRTSAIAFVLALVALSVASATPASAAPVIPINWTVDVTTTLKALNQTVVVPTGTFNGSVDLADPTNGVLTGNLTLPPASSTMKIGGLPLATAVFEMQQAAPITGSINLLTGTATTTASFNIRLRSLKPTLLPINLVGSNCRTSTPVTTTMTGPISLTSASSFSGTYTIPKFKDCGFFVTPIINLIIPSSGNTMTATFAPPAP